jgi:hypothetical protein
MYESKEKLIKEIETDLDEIDYIKRNYNLDQLSKKEIEELYLSISNAWLIIQKVVRVDRKV